jgi:multidrug transporter EmrE-like cation transporter
VVFSVYCHSKRGDSHLGTEIEQWFYAAMAIAGCNGGIWGRVLLSVAALHTISVGVAYAIWSGAGIVPITLVAWFVLGQSLDMPAILGLALIVAGVIVLKVFSRPRLINVMQIGRKRAAVTL